MSLLLIALLALIQGLTEFLPISSSAHLILVNQLTGASDQGTVFDVAAHLGSLFGVIWYFRADVLSMARNHALPEYGGINGYAMIAWLVLATLPVGIVGLAGADWIETHLRSVWVIALSTITFAGVLWFANVVARTQNTTDGRPTLKIALIMGLGQMLALIPGASRSGVTLSAGIFAGLSMQQASRLAFLMGIPTLLAAGGFGLMQMSQGASRLSWLEFSLSVGLSAIAAWCCIDLFLRFVHRIGLMPFVVYRLILGGLLLAVIAIR